MTKECHGNSRKGKAWHGLGQLIVVINPHKCQLGSQTDELHAQYVQAKDISVSYFVFQGTRKIGDLSIFHEHKNQPLLHTVN